MCVRVFSPLFFGGNQVPGSKQPWSSKSPVFWSSNINLQLDPMSIAVSARAYTTPTRSTCLLLEIHHSFTNKSLPVPAPDHPLALQDYLYL